MKTLLTVQEAAKLLGVATKTLRRWEETGRLIPQRTIGQHRRYSQEQLEGFIKKGKRIIPIDHLTSNNHSESHSLSSFEPNTPSFKKIVDVYQGLDMAKKAVIAGNLALVVVVGSLVILTKTGIIRPIFQDVKQIEVNGLSYEDKARNKAVLGESSQARSYTFNVNVPAKFNETGEFEKDLTVKGKTVLGETVIGGSIIATGKDLNLGGGKITASNIIYSLTTGDGLKIEAGQNPTLSNTGVLSFNGKTGTVTGVSSIQGATGAITLSEGTGIDISSLEISNSDPGSSQKIFKNVIVGATTITAGSNTDSLEIAAGDGITIESNASNKLITISAASTNYWQRSGGILSPLTVSDVLSVPGLTISSLNGLLKGTSGTVGVATAGLDYESPLTFSSPLSRSANTISLSAATGSTNGYLSSVDWTTFNSKQNSLTLGNLSTSTDGLTVSGGTSAIIGTGLTIDIESASGSQDGLLSSTDWTAFNSKEAALSAGLTTQYYRGDKSWQTLDTLAVAENTNLYYTDARARDVLSSSDPITYNSTTGALGFSYNSTNLQVASNALNTIQNIATTSSPTFTGLTISGLISDGVVIASAGSLSSETKLAIARGGTNSTSTPNQGGIAYGDGSAYQFTLAGNSGQILKSNGTEAPIWIDAESLGLNLWQRNSGAITPLYISDSLNLGSTASSSALIHLAGTSAENSWINTGNVGIGVTNPSQKLEVSGTVKSTGLVISNLTGILMASSGTVGTASGGTDFEFPLTFSSPFSRTDNEISIPVATNSTSGYLTSADWTTFNSKEAALSAGLTTQYYRGDKSWQTLDTLAVAENTNLYYTDARARDALSSSDPISYNSTTGALGLSYNSTNLQITSNALNTIQNITTTSSPTFNSLTLQQAGSSLAFSSGLAQITTAESQHLTLMPGGNLGIGTTAPGQKFDVNGIVNSTGYYLNNSPIDLTNYWSRDTGTATLTTATALDKLTLGGLATFNAGATIADGTELTVAGNIASNLTPSASGQYDLGTAINEWRNIYGQNFYLSGDLITTGSQAGFWQRNSGAIAPTNVSDDFLVGGTTTASATFRISGTSPDASLSARLIIAPTEDNQAALRIIEAPNTSGNIFEIMKNDLSSTYLAVDNSGVLSVGGYKLTNAGIFESSGAINLTSSDNTIVGTAIEGGWTMNSNPFTYKRTVTITAVGGNLPSNYEVTLALTGAQAQQMFAATQTQTTPWYDLRIASGSCPSAVSDCTEIARNVTAFTANGVTIKFQLQEQINSLASDTYTIFYGNDDLSSIPSEYSSYNGEQQLETADDSSVFAGTGSSFTLSNETTSPTPQEGTASLKTVAGIGDVNNFTSAEQGQLAATIKDPSIAFINMTGTRFAYVVGGNTGNASGTVTNSIYKAPLTGFNSGTLTATSNQLPAEGREGLVAITTTGSVFSGGTGSDGTLDLSLGSGAGGCNGTGLSWNSGSSTCTIAYGTKSTYNFTSVNVPVGTILTISGTPAEPQSNFPVINVTGNVTVAGTINLNGLGFAATAGTGAGANGGTDGDSNGAGGGGASHGASGGRGEDVMVAIAGNPGSTYSTQSFGSGGGHEGNGMHDNTAGKGGGGIKITSGGNITISGSITANATAGSTGGGGGSGGRIQLQANAVTVETGGSITANGGNGGNGLDNCGEYDCVGAGGGGGGGRILIEAGTSSYSNSGTVTASGGTKGTAVGVGQNNQANGSAFTVSPDTSQAAPYNLYAIGGADNTGTVRNTVYKASIDGAGDVSTSLSTTSQGQLGTALVGHTGATVETTVFVIGGTTDGTANGASASIYKSAISNSNLGAWSATTAPLPSARYDHASAVLAIGSNNYIYIAGGKNSSGAATDTLYKATVSSGNVTAVSDTGVVLPGARSDLQAFTTAIGPKYYLYLVGGKDNTDTATNNIWRIEIDASGNPVGSFSTTNQSQLSSGAQNLHGHGLLAVPGSGDNANNTFLFIYGGRNNSPANVSTVYKSVVNDMFNYTATRTFNAPYNLSNINDIGFKVYSSATGSNLRFEILDGSGNWQNCSSTNISSANTWESHSCSIISMTRNSVSAIRFRVAATQSAALTSYFDDIKAYPSFNTVSNTVSSSRALAGAADLSLRSQGTGGIMLNYDPLGAAGSGGIKFYDGSTGFMFGIDTAGTASVSGGLTFTAATSSAQINLLNGQDLTFKTSLGGDAGLGTAITLKNNGYLGIGTTSPTTKLYVSESNNASGYAAYFHNTSSDANADGIAIRLRSDATNPATTNRYLQFMKGDGTFVGRIAGNGSGGTALTSGAGDFAEWFKLAPKFVDELKASTDSGSFKANDHVPPGTLMCLSQDGALPCDGQNKQILGVISNSAIVIGKGENEEKEDYAIIGMLGQLKVKVNKEGGEIKVGDPIASSSQKGVAKKANARGYIVGRAVENFTGENLEGEIEITLSPTFFDPGLEIALTNDPIGSASSEITYLTNKINALTELVMAQSSTSGSLLDLISKNSDSSMSTSQTVIEEIKGSKLAIDGNASILGDLMVGGRTVLGDTGITGSLGIGTLNINNGSIENLAGDLKLQASGTGGVDILAGKVKINKDGTTSFSENVTFAKDIEVKGVLSAQTVNAEEIKLRKATITEISTTEIATTKPGGSTTIQTGETTRTIKSSLIKPDSLVYVTPLSDTNNQTLFISDQKEGEFTVSIKQDQIKAIRFNFLIINQED